MTNEKVTAEDMCIYIVQTAQDQQSDRVVYGKLLKEYGPRELFDASPTGELFHMIDLYRWAQEISGDDNDK